MKPENDAQPALAHGVPVLIAGDPDGMKNIRHHPGVKGHYPTVEEALAAGGAEGE